MPTPPARSIEVDDDAFPAASAGPRNPRLERWVDLLAALLGRSTPATFKELTAAVPEYHAKDVIAEAAPDDGTRARLADTLKRAFERDKDALRALGVAIESLPDEHGNSGGSYRLQRNNFYLPYLCIAVPGGALRSPARVDQYGYKALTSLVLAPEELEAIVDAAATIRGLGDPLLRADIDGAMRKLAVDLPLDAAEASAELPRLIASRTQPDASVFAALGDALRHRKRVTFVYRAMSSGQRETRAVEPYGLFFLSGHWYLVGRDGGREERRNFRLNRISDVTQPNKAKQTPDYAVPATFRIRDHAQSRHVWELGEGDASQVLVEFRGESGPLLAAAALGEPVDGVATQRRFTVRRVDSFARWILSFGGEAIVRAPESLAAAVQARATATHALYVVPAPDPLPVPSAGAPVERTGARVPWQSRGAAAQLQRILAVIPQIADGEEHQLSDVAERIGTDVATVQQDLLSLVDRYDLPAGFVEGVQVYLDADRVSARSNHLRRPMRLTVSELCALELGLAVLRTQRPQNEHAVLDRVRARLTSIIVTLPDDPIPDSLYNISIGEYGSTAHLPVVRHGLRTRTRVRLGYRKSGATSADERIVCPYALVAAHGMLYLIAHCDRSAGLRVFRMDRIAQAAAMEISFEPPVNFSIEGVFRDGRVFQGEEPDVMLVRYSPQIARWIAEREGRVLDADGGLVLQHPLADVDWAVRHALQYAEHAEVLRPVALRARLHEQLARMLVSA